VIKKISISFQLVIIISFVFLFGKYLGHKIPVFFYTFSLLFKELLSVFLPIIVFSFILAGILSFKKNAPLVLFFLLSITTASNFLVMILVFFIIKIVINPISAIGDTTSLAFQNGINPLFSFSFPSIVSPEKALLTAVILGVVFSFINNNKVNQAAIKLKQIVEKVLKYFFIPLIPLYVLGFLLKLVCENSFLPIFASYGTMFLFIIAIQILYVVFLYFFVSGFKIKSTLKNIKEILPSYITAFSTMSSTATIPVTIKSVVKMTKNSPLAQMGVPILANVHMLGDAVAIPILSIVTMKIFFGYIPSFTVYLKFTTYFCTMLFAASGIPGGGIIIMLPFLKSIFGFSPEMVSLAITLHLLQDSFGTASNVAGDGAISLLVNRMLKKLKVPSS
jgi:Na+/H+-dicarboxylate symporter